jgi:hypothetical protein
MDNIKMDLLEIGLSVVVEPQNNPIGGSFVMKFEDV